MNLIKHLHSDNQENGRKKARSEKDKKRIKKQLQPQEERIKLFRGLREEKI